MNTLPSKLLRKFVLPWVPARRRLAFRVWTAIRIDHAEPEMEHIDRILPSRRGRAIDVGANAGLYSWLLYTRFRSVEAFEPIAAASTDLTRANLKNVALHTCALSSSEGTATLYTPLNPDGVPIRSWTSFSRDNLKDACGVIEQTVPMRTLDSFGFEDVSFIKIDVEGHELAMLAGAADTLRRCRPVVLVEVREQNLEAVRLIFGNLGFGEVDTDPLVGRTPSDSYRENRLFSPDPEAHPTPDRP